MLIFAFSTHVVFARARHRLRQVFLAKPFILEFVSGFSFVMWAVGFLPQNPQWPEFTDAYGVTEGFLALAGNALGCIQICMILIGTVSLRRAVSVLCLFAWLTLSLLNVAVFGVISPMSNLLLSLAVFNAWVFFQLPRLGEWYGDF